MRRWTLVLMAALLCGAFSAAAFDVSPPDSGTVVAEEGDDGEGSDAHIVDLRAETISYDTIILSWNGTSSTGIDHFQVFVNETGPPEPTLENRTQDSSISVHRFFGSLDPLTEYHFRVRPVDEQDRTGELSESVSNSTLARLIIDPQEHQMAMRDLRPVTYNLSLDPVPKGKVHVSIGGDVWAFQVSRVSDGAEVNSSVVIDESQPYVSLEVTPKENVTHSWYRLVHRIDPSHSDRNVSYDTTRLDSLGLVVDPAIPFPVDSVKGVPINSSTVKLEWEAPPDSFRTGYDVLVEPNDPIGEWIDQGPAPVSSPPTPEPFPWMELRDWEWLLGFSTSPWMTLEDPHATEAIISGLDPATLYRFEVTPRTDDIRKLGGITEASTRHAPALDLPGDFFVKEGESATYSAELGFQPDGRTLVWDLTAHHPGITVSPEQVVFDGVTSGVPVTVTAQRDHVDDGNETIALDHVFNRTASDEDDPVATLHGMRVFLVDPDRAGVRLEPDRVELDEGESATIRVRPETRPSHGKIGISFTSGEPDQVRVTPEQVVFGEADRDEAREVVVEALYSVPPNNRPRNVSIEVSVESPAPEYETVDGTLPVMVHPVATPPDLGLNVEIIPATPAAGQDVTLEATLENDGFRPLTGLVVVYEWNEWPVHRETVDHLEPGEDVVLEKRLPVEPGSHEVRVDVLGIINKTRHLEVADDGEEGLNLEAEEDIPGPGAIGIGMLTMILLYRIRRRKALGSHSCG